jgi:hypothetical protein
VRRNRKEYDMSTENSRPAVVGQVEPSVRQPAWTPASDTETLRLTIAHYKTAMRMAVRLARNSLRTNSRDIQDWREDMNVLADCLERQIDA